MKRNPEITNHGPRISNSLLERAGGYDFANLWMNMAKLVIALVFLYQNALDTQLGVRLFDDYFYVFHVPVSQNPESDPASEVVTPEDPFFSIEFKPLALAQNYDEFTVQVLGITGGEGRSLLPEPAGSAPCRRAAPDCAYFTWEQLTAGNKAVLHRASFDLLELVADQAGLTSGDYRVEFGFNFFRHGQPLGRQRRTHTGVLKFLRQEQQRYGDVPVVQGRPFRVPKLVLDQLGEGGSWGGWDVHRELRVLEGAAEGGWKGGAILREDLERGWLEPFRSLASGRTYEQRGHYFDRQNVRVDFTIGFNLLRNEPPRSTYLGPGDSDIHFVRIFYEWHFFEERQGYYYYNLSRHIIDPDGTTAPLDGRPDVRVRAFDGLQPEDLPYRLQRDRATGDWHLRIVGDVDDSLRRGSAHDLSLVARDDFQSQRIRVRIER